MHQESVCIVYMLICIAAHQIKAMDQPAHTPNAQIHLNVPYVWLILSPDQQIVSHIQVMNWKVIWLQKQNFNKAVKCEENCC